LQVQIGALVAAILALIVLTDLQDASVLPNVSNAEDNAGALRAAFYC
jgi:hypothetical protein